ncbi:hypothetical protein BTVI_50167 [Pitangus sulphuratus]|nr:hypothetical protein BTVI_50167 [Pitangus sulphuratus]
MNQPFSRMLEEDHEVKGLLVFGLYGQYHVLGLPEGRGGGDGISLDKLRELAPAAPGGHVAPIGQSCPACIVGDSDSHSAADEQLWLLQKYVKQLHHDLSSHADVYIRKSEPVLALGSVEESLIPVFNQGRKEDPGNYRPVSLTSILGKVMESLILEGISIHMDDKTVIRSSQHGFTKGKSYLTNLIAFYDETATWMDEQTAMDVVYLDFSKAFDMISS